MAFYFVSLYCDLRALLVYGWRFTAWKAGSVGALLVSTFARNRPPVISHQPTARAVQGWDLPDQAAREAENPDGITLPLW
jgi:hypothetical protein